MGQKYYNNYSEITMTDVAIYKSLDVAVVFRFQPVKENNGN